MKKIHRFTLIELLAVIGLIAILGAIGFGVYSLSRNKAKESSTEALLKQLETGLEKLKENSHYPQSASKDDGSEFSVITVTFAADGTVSEIDFGDEKLIRQTASQPTKAQRMKQERFDAFVKAVNIQVLKSNCGKDGVLRDAWGGKIYYRAPSRFKKNSFDLLSAGPDGVFSSDGKSTPQMEQGYIKLDKFRETNGDKVCDDLFNF